MKDQHIKEIRAAVVAANPSILDLKVGCELMYQNRKYGIFGISMSCFRICTLEGDSFSTDTIVDQDTLGVQEILGRPIRLADVFLAIETQLGSGKKIVWDARESIVKHVVRRWNLRADRLEDQSTETLALIAELLKQP